MTRVPYAGDEKASLHASLDRLDLSATGTAWFGDTVRLRWVLIHVLEDTARHAGHADIVRELIDGSTGDHRRSDPGEAVPGWPGS